MSCEQILKRWCLSGKKCQARREKDYNNCVERQRETYTYKIGVDTERRSSESEGEKEQIEGIVKQAGTIFIIIIVLVLIFSFMRG